MNNIVFDFRHNYVRGERLESQEIVYQCDEGRVIEAYVPEQEGFVLNVGYESDSTLYVVEVNSTTADTEGGYKILATLPDTFLARHGNLLVYVIAGEDEMIVTTYEGVVPVLPKAVSEDYVVPTEQESSILARCAAAANASEEEALAAEGYALGTQDGTPVSSGTYYHNNAAYHSGQSAANALVSEGYAVGTQDGTAIESGSPYYENNAKYYAEQTAASLNGVLWQTDIVDNATTSDTTKVPSAAVAKSLQDQIGTVPSGSTLQGQINALNSNTSVVSSVVTKLYCAKSGNLVTMATGGAVTARTWAAYESYLIGTVPTGYRPARECNFAVPASDRSITMRCIVQTGGNVYIYNPGGAISTATSIVVFAVTYSLV